MLHSEAIQLYLITLAKHWVINDQLELILGERFYESLKRKSYRSYCN